jgi:hypothetical protein
VASEAVASEAKKDVIVKNENIKYSGLIYILLY